MVKPARVPVSRSVRECLERRSGCNCEAHVNCAHGLVNRPLKFPKIHHVDKDRSNSGDVENLLFVCGSCHDVLDDESVEFARRVVRYRRDRWSLT